MQNRKVRRESRKEDEPGRGDGLLANPDFARQVMGAAATTNGLEEKYHFRALMSDAGAILWYLQYIATRSQGAPPRPDF